MRTLLSSFCLPSDPPGPPNIDGYHDGQVVRTNDTVLLTCMSRGGNPLGTVVWYRNNERVDSSFTSGGNRAINEYTFTALSTDNGAEYRCEVTNLMTQDPLTDSRTLIVNCKFGVLLLNSCFELSKFGLIYQLVLFGEKFFFTLHSLSVYFINYKFGFCFWTVVTRNNSILGAFTSLLLRDTLFLGLIHTQPVFIVSCKFGVLALDNQDFKVEQSKFGFTSL
jgi:hypothetical protein